MTTRCLLHVCLSDEHFPEFLQRGKKLTRTQLDAKAKNSFWHAAAITFCDTSKTFDLIDFPLLGGLSRGYIG